MIKVRKKDFSSQTVKPYFDIIEDRRQVSRLQEQYKNEIIPQLKEELGVSNALSVPKIEKITINMGLGSALGDKKVLESALEEPVQIPSANQADQISKER